MPIYDAPNRIPALLAIPRSEIEASDTTATIEKLRSLSNSRENVHAHAQNVFVTFSGYDDDPRELHEIRDVHLFFKKISMEWPYWAHFIYPEPDLVRILVLLSMDAERVFDTPGSVWMSVDLDDVDDVFT